LLIGAAVLAAVVAVTIIRPIGPKVTPPAGAPSTTRCPNQTAPADSITLGEWQDAVRCLVNGERVRRHLRPLSFDRRLARAGRHHAASMDAHDYFSHTEPSGSTVRDRAFAFDYAPGIGTWKVGEDLGWVSGSKATPRSTVQAWMNSPTHRRQILTRSYRNVAIAAVRGAPSPSGSEAGSVTVAAEFGHR
jgi:uncharacterized protein YkwD